NTGGTVAIKNSSSIVNNAGLADDGSEVSPDDVLNLGVLYRETTSTIGILDGNPVILLDPGAAQLQIHDVSVTEGNTGTVAAEFTVTLTAASTQTITVAYAT